MPRSKYNAKPTTIRGIRFDSQAEANHYLFLLSRLQAGEIDDLIIQPRYTVWKHGKEKITYVGDFEYLENGRKICADVKGFETQVFRIKAKLFRATYPDIELRIVK